MRSRKGLSSFIATTTLILMGVVLGVLVSSWASDLSKTEANRIANRTSERLLCERGQFTITNAFYNCSGDCSAGINHTLMLTLKNTGDIKLSMKKIIVANKYGEMLTLEPNVTSLDASEIRLVGNVSRESCGRFNRTIDEIMVSSSCPSVYDTLPGTEITYQNC